MPKKKKSQRLADLAEQKRRQKATGRSGGPNRAGNVKVPLPPTSLAKLGSKPGLVRAALRKK